MALDPNATTAGGPPSFADSVAAGINSSNAASSAGNADTSNSTPSAAQPAQPSAGQPASPAPAAQPAQPIQPAVTAPPVAPSRNQQLHGFVSSVLSGIASSMAGKGPVRYTTDANGKVIADPNQPQDSTKDKLRRIGATALAGLAAGSQVPQQKSGAASGLAGLGAGFASQQNAALKQDQAAKEEARKNDEAAQQKILRQADIARTNALTYTTWQHAMDEELDHDPQRQQYKQWADAAEQGGMKVQTMTEAELAQARKTDPTFVGNHLVFPGGFSPQTGPNGEVLMDPKTGQPLRSGKVIVIQGGHMNPDGTAAIPVPQSLIDEVKKFGPAQGVTGQDDLKAGDEVDPAHYFKFIGIAQEGKKEEIKGWINPKISVDKSGKTFETNNYTGETREAQALPTKDAEAIAGIDQKESEKKKNDAQTTLVPSEINRNNAQANAENAKAAKDKGDTNPVNPASAGLTGDDYLKTLPVGDAAALKAVAEGRETRSPRQLLDSKGNLTPFAQKLHQAYPDMDITKLASYAKVRDDFEKGKTSVALNGGGTALKHLQELQKLNTLESRVPGTAAYGKFQNQLDTVAGELLTFYGMPKTNESIAGMKKTLGTIGNRDSAIQQQAKSMGEKLESYEQTWKNAQPRPSYTPPMPSIDENAKKAMHALNPEYAEQHPSLFGAAQPAQSGSVSGQANQPPVPEGATNPVYAADGKTLIGHVVNGKYVALGAQ